jgi:RNA polymerase sigma factor FliA
MEHRRLWKQLAAGSEQARDELLNAHLPLVGRVARQLAGRLSVRQEPDELVSYGTIGLIAALDSFDTTRGLAFSTYAVPRIRGAILDELRRQDHVPRSVRRNARAVAHVREALSQTNGRQASDAEVAEHLGLAPITLSHWSAVTSGAAPISIEESLMSDDGELAAGYEELTTNDVLEVEENLTREQELRVMTDTLRSLKPQERHVLVLYYYEELKMHEVADVLGITESRVSQIRTAALAALRGRMAPLRGGSVAAAG